MSKSSFLLARDEDLQSVLWCQGPFDNFYVINGAWYGSYDGTDVIVKGNNYHVPNVKVAWSGVVAEEHNHTYDDAIKWIKEQIALNNSKKHGVIND